MDEILFQRVNNTSRVDLSGKDLSRFNLSGANLNKADLSNANLTETDLSHTSLRGANLAGAILRRADLRGADLGDAILRKADLKEAILQGVKLDRLDMSGADLRGVEFLDVSLEGTDLSEALLCGAVLNEKTLKDKGLRRANLNLADLRGADLRGAILRGADLSQAYLQRADLSGADLRWANLSGAYLNDADLTGCLIHGVSAWTVKLNKNTKQTGLIITNVDNTEQAAPTDVEQQLNTITVDDLEVAQFINLLLDNDKIGNAINAINSKVVLILGRFTEDRKSVLDALRRQLRTSYDYVPIVFDFEPPKSQTLTETINTLAQISRFIIADLTDPNSIPQELGTIVPHRCVPIKPLFHPSKSQPQSQPYPLLKDLSVYPWMLPIYWYYDKETLIRSLKKEVIDPAEKKIKEHEENTKEWAKEYEDQKKGYEERVKEYEDQKKEYEERVKEYEDQKKEVIDPAEGKTE